MKRALWCVGWVVMGCAGEPTSAPSSASAAGSVQATASSSAARSAVVPAQLRERVLAFFDDVATRQAEAILAVNKRGPKSRLAYAEALIQASPVAFPLHQDLFSKHKLTMPEFQQAMADDAFSSECIAQLQKKIEVPLKSIDAPLPADSAEDCGALARRTIELMQTEATRGVGQALAQSVVSCIGSHPALTECLPKPGGKPDLAAYDACVAKSQPQKK